MTAIMATVVAAPDHVCMQTNPSLAVEHDPFGQFRADHVRVLAEIGRLEQRALAGGGVPDEPALRAAAELLTIQFATHMTAEEKVLYPAIRAAFPAGRATLEALNADHTELRLMLAAITRWLDAPASAGRDEQLQVVLRDFIDLLRLHIHREESAVFDVASRVLSSSEAEELALRITPHVDLNPPPGREPGAAKGSPS
jgi:iron-sulfur cluster repair protein YtfE (RIC family)